MRGESWQASLVICLLPLQGRGPAASPLLGPGSAPGVLLMLLKVDQHPNEGVLIFPGRGGLFFQGVDSIPFLGLRGGLRLIALSQGCKVGQASPGRLPWQQGSSNQQRHPGLAGKHDRCLLWWGHSLVCLRLWGPQ